MISKSLNFWQLSIFPIVICPLVTMCQSFLLSAAITLIMVVVWCLTICIQTLLPATLQPPLKLIATLITAATASICIQLTLQAYHFDLYKALGIAIPVIASNYFLYLPWQNPSSTNAAKQLGHKLAVIFSLAPFLILIGSLREYLSTGKISTNFTPSHLIATNAEHTGLLVATSPAGAFIFMGLLLALFNVIDLRRPPPVQVEQIQPVLTGNKRVRTTGHIP